MVRIAPATAFGIRDLIFEGLFRYPVILIAAFVSVIYLTRKQVKGKLLWAMGSYLLLISLAMAFAFLARDEFGFSFIPVAMTVWPWYHILSKFSGLSTVGMYGFFVEISLGAILNCTLLYIVGRLSYPKHSEELSDRHAT